MGEDKGKEKELPAPVDVLVDTLIGFLEKGTAYLRAAANQAFSLLSSSVQESTIDLILTVSLHPLLFFLRGGGLREPRARSVVRGLRQELIFRISVANRAPRL